VDKNNRKTSLKEIFMAKSGQSCLFKAKSGPIFAISEV
jgi:hypothetical protein